MPRAKQGPAKQQSAHPKKRRTDPVARESASILDERIECLGACFPEAVVEGKVHFDKLKEALGDLEDERSERYSFTWAGKRDAMRLLRMPTRATLVPVSEESVNFDATRNLFIEGDNLEVQKLLYKSLAGRVKAIVIDPPYNTGNDFIYPDNFTDPLATYLKLTGQKDADGNMLTDNRETSGRYHSAWLSMMYPRLVFARQVLRDDGVICVSIDDTELHNLRMLLDEIFGGENFLMCFARRTKSGGGSASHFFAGEHDYVLSYARNKKTLLPLYIPYDEEYAQRYNEEDELGRYFWDTFERSYTRTRPYKITAPDGRLLEGKWFRAEYRYKKDLAAGEIRFVRKDDGSWSVQFKQRMPKGRKLRSLMHETEYKSSQSELDALAIKGFPHPKPVFLLKRLIDATTDDSDMILDFFAGSCTTAHAVLELNREQSSKRRFIMVQLPEKCDKSTEAGAEAVRMGCASIADIGKERMRRVIEKMKSERQGELALKDRNAPEDLGFKVFKLTESHYRRWAGVEGRDPEMYADTMELFTDPLLPGWKPENVLYEIILKEGFSLTSRIEKGSFPKSAASRKSKPNTHREEAANTFYCVTDDDKGQILRVCLDDTLHQEAIKALELRDEDLFICRDIALTDELAANLALQCRMKTI